MKQRLPLFLFCILAVFTVSAQTIDTVRFKGHPIGGTMEDFVQMMMKEGYEYVEQNNDIVVMSGTYCGQDSCLIFVSPMPGGDWVNSVCVTFPKEDSWKLLKRYYLLLKDVLVEQYGECYRSVEEFMSGYEDGDGNEMEAVRKDRVFYYSDWGKGAITLSVSKSQRVILKYKNKRSDKGHPYGGKGVSIDDL